MRFFKVGGTAAWRLLLGSVLSVCVTGLFVDRTAGARYQRDVSRMVFNDNLELLTDVRRRVGAASDSLNGLLEGATDSVEARGSIVVSIADHRLWYRFGDTVVFETRVATGSGRELSKGRGKGWKFETPRGRLVVVSKESDPTWVPPDWHFVEVAKKKHLRLTPLLRGKTVDAGDGSAITVSGNDVVRRLPDGSVQPYESGEGKEIIVKGMLIVPPFGTNQRRFAGVVGTERLNLGDGYALHGTDVPSSIGQSVSHGCVRLRNEDIETLFRIVPIGTPVYIY
jgi:hypothetical protein